MCNYLESFCSYCRCSASYFALNECSAIMLFGLKNTSLIERIYPDNVFWLENIQRVNFFFTKAILPELIGKFYLKPMATNSHQGSPSLKSPSDPTIEKITVYKYYYCHEDKQQEEMIGVKILNAVTIVQFLLPEFILKPKSRVRYCPVYRKLPQFRRKTSKRA